MKIFKDVFSQHGFVYNQISSYDDFLGENGVKNIIENMFKVYNFMDINTPNQLGVKSIKIDIGFKNAFVEEQKTVNEKIYDVNLSADDQSNNDAIQKKLSGLNSPQTSDINLPANCRNFLRTLKVNVYSDIVIKLQSFTKEQGGGEEIASKTQELKRQLVAELPLMMGSKFSSISKKTVQEKINLHEDALDTGGYFIIKGNEWSIDFTESFNFNELQLKNVVKNKLVEGFIISKNGDSFEPSYQITIIYQYKTNKILLKLLDSEKIKYIELPFYLVFKIFGITNQVQMTEMIIQDDVNSQSEVSSTLKKIIQQATNVEYEVFKDAFFWDTPHDVCKNIAEILNREEYNREPVDKYIKYTPERVRDSFQEFFLTHLGQTALSNNKKMRYLGAKIKKVLLAHLTGDFPDQHTYLEKRIHATGYNLAKQFKKIFNHVVIQQMKRKLFSELENITDISKIDAGQIISSLLNNHVQLKNIQKAIITGSGSDISKQGGLNIKSSIQSQRLIRKNVISSLCQMWMINNKKQSLDKQSKQIIKQRSVQPSFAGYVCVVQSSDNGEKAGKLKSLASLAIITNSQSSRTITDKLWEVLEPHQIMFDIDTFQSKHIAEYKLQHVYVNGFWVGFIQNKDVNKAANILRKYRRDQFFEWKYVTVYVNEEMDLYIYSDYGRILVPMIIVHEDKNGNPYHNITTENAHKIIHGSPTIDWYLDKQIFEYVSVEEAHNCLIAETPADYLTKTDSSRSLANRYRFTHIFIPQSLLGIAALLSPFMNHAQTKRITMFTNQVKQACGWAMYNYPYRMDKGTIIQQYISQPLIKTVMHDFFPTNGQTIMVAYTVYDGQNQEDSVIANKGSVDHGMFNGVYYTYEETQIKGWEDVIRITATQPENKKTNYTKLENGIIRIGSWIEKEDVIVAKHQPPRNDEAEHDTSLVYKGDEPAFVEDVHIVQDEADVFTIRVKLRQVRNLKQGDKFSSGQGCKAIISKILPAHDMPYTKEGEIPDIIFNPHSIPTRMMIGQLIEASLQRICSEICDTIDGTAFTDMSVEFINDLMKEAKIEDHGYKYLYNGQTGERLKAKIFLVPTFYYRLQKFAITGKYVVDNANRDVLSRQPLASRRQLGGSRLGEMEKDTFYSSGVSSILHEKFYEHSDAFNMKVCKQCGSLADFNSTPGSNVYNCSKCQNNAEIVNVQSSWGALLFQQTIKSMQMDMQLTMEEPQIEQYL